MDEFDRFEEDPRHALCDVVAGQGEGALGADIRVCGRGISEEEGISGVTCGLCDGGADGRGDFAVCDVRDDEPETPGHAIGHCAQVGSRAVARLKDAVLLQSVQRETNRRAGDLEAADELLLARELAVCAELAVQDLPPQGREDFGRDASLLGDAHSEHSIAH